VFSKISPLFRHLLWIGALLLAAAVVFGYFRARGVAVDVVTAENAPIKQTLVFSARVSSVARTEIASTLTARVERVLVREGDRVKAGQLLVVLDDDELRAQSAQARAALASAQARLRAQAEVALPVSAQSVRQAQTNLDFARREAERQRALFAQGFIGQARLQEADRALSLAQSALAQAEAQSASNKPSGAETIASQARVRETEAAVALADAKLAQMRIVAPADGRIVLRSVEVGDVVQAARRLLVLSADGETRLVAQVDEKNLALLREGMQSLASTDAFPDKPFTAQLSYLAPAADAARGTVEARLVVKDPPTFLRDEMTVSVEVVTAQKASAMILPAAALREAEGKSSVLVLDDGRAREQAVRIGIRTPQRVEVQEGVVVGQQVIVNAAIVAGQRVRSQPQQKRASASGENPMAVGR
jgi:HlyD family secretion protein